MVIELRGRGGEGSPQIPLIKKLNEVKPNRREAARQIMEEEKQKHFRGRELVKTAD